jgi:hypothetical protein
VLILRLIVLGWGIVSIRTAWQGLRTGRAWTRDGTIREHKHPVQFWSALLFQFGLGLTLLVMAVLPWSH